MDDMKIAVITANLGDFDKRIDYAPQSVPYDFYLFTDENFPPRYCAMTPRLQAKFPKMFGWQMVPEHDYYLWVDSSFTLPHPDSVKWFMQQCKDVDLALLKHPERNSIQQEADFLKKKFARKSQYVISRYQNELLDEQVEAIKSDKNYEDNQLFAGGFIIYRNVAAVREAMKEWWYHTSRYAIEDQLSLPYAMWKSGCNYRVVPDNFLKTPYLKYVRS